MPETHACLVRQPGAQPNPRHACPRRRHAWRGSQALYQTPGMHARDARMPGEATRRSTKPQACMPETHACLARQPGALPNPRHACPRRTHAWRGSQALYQTPGMHARDARMPGETASALPNPRHACPRRTHAWRGSQALYQWVTAPSLMVLCHPNVVYMMASVISGESASLLTQAVTWIDVFALPERFNKVRKMSITF